MSSMAKVAVLTQARTGAKPAALSEIAREGPPAMASVLGKVPAAKAARRIWALQEVPWDTVGLQSVARRNQPASLMETAARPSVS